MKKRPALIISSDSVGRLPIKLVAPITGWNEKFTHSFWLVKIVPNSNNGLTKESAIDALQVRGVDVQRFIKKIGAVPSTTLEEVAAAVAALIEYQ